MTVCPRLATQLLAIAAGFFAAPATLAAKDAPTLESGFFGDDRLILAAAPEQGTLSGYFRDGDCRVFFSGALTPIAHPQPADIGETYEVQSWDPHRPDALFTTTIYSRARGGFFDQVTLSPGPDDPDRPRACRWRISLDRASHVSNGFIGAGVIARSRPRRFEIERVGDTLRPVARGRAALTRDAGVWIEKTYGAAWSPPGLVRIAWYDPPGTPQAAYVRERDLYPLRPNAREESLGLPCMVAKAGQFEPLGDCAVANADGSYTVGRATVKQLSFSHDGLAAIVLRGEGYAYVRRDGRALLVPTFDNAPDEFASGLVRVRIGDKLGYADRRLKLVIPAIYDGAHPFIKARAWACIGCTLASDGEHSWYRGGQAVCLDPGGHKRPEAECGHVQEDRGGRSDISTYIQGRAVGADARPYQPTASG